MWKQVAIALLGMAVVLAACQPGQPQGTAENIPAQTPSPRSTVVPETQHSAVEPLHTDLPPSPRCFPFEEVSPITFMPDSTRLVIKERSGVRILNLETLEEEILKASQELVSVALSPDGELLAWSLMDNTIQLIRTDDQTLVKTMEGHTLPTFKLRFSPTGDRLFSASSDTWVRIWDRNGELIDAFQPTGANE